MTTRRRCLKISLSEPLLTLNAFSVLPVLHFDCRRPAADDSTRLVRSSRMVARPSTVTLVPHARLSVTTSEAFNLRRSLPSLDATLDSGHPTPDISYRGTDGPYDMNAPKICLHSTAVFLVVYPQHPPISSRSATKPSRTKSDNTP